MDGFCNVFLKKRFVKCISKKEGICYVFIGKIPYIKSITNKIKKNKKNNEEDYFQNVTEEEIQELFDYFNGSSEESNSEIQKNIIKEIMFLDKYPSDKLVFVNESINEDDTNEIITRKIICHCYQKQIVTLPFIYAWYLDGDKNIPLTFEYEDKSITYDDFFDSIPKKHIDSSLIDGNGDRLPKQIINKKLILSEKNRNELNIIHFVALEEYLDRQNMFEEILKFSEEEIKGKKELKSFMNGLIFKYWPDISLSDILTYKNDDSIVVRKDIYEKQKEINDIYNRGMYIIESEFLGQDVNEKINCKNYSLTIIRLLKDSPENNTVHLSKLFTEFNLRNEVPFMKLLLDSHDDAFYKLYENSLLYEGSEKSKQRHISKERCKKWSDGYNNPTEYGYNYLHSGNIILFKIYNIENDIYCTLIIHLNGDIECIIEHNDKELRQEEIEYMVQHDCNALISEINTNQFYSFKELQLFDDDFFTNIHSKTYVDFLNF